jgi:hypothetical protein
VTVLVPDEDHRARNPRIGKHRRIMPRSAWYWLIRQTQLAGGGPQFFDPCRVHDGGRRLQAPVELEFYATFFLDAPALRNKKVIKCFQCLLALAPGFEAEIDSAGNTGDSVLRTVRPHHA